MEEHLHEHDIVLTEEEKEKQLNFDREQLLKDKGEQLNLLEEEKSFLSKYIKICKETRQQIFNEIKEDEELQVSDYYFDKFKQLELLNDCLYQIEKEIKETELEFEEIKKLFVNG